MSANYLKYPLSLLLALAPLSPALADTSQAWNLPKALDEKNTRIAFDLFTTWENFLVTTKAYGQAWLDDPRNSQSVRLEVHLPVTSFAADDPDIDEDIWDAMGSSSFPEVVFKSTEINDLCPPHEVDGGKECHGMMHGTLCIRDTKRQVDIPYGIRRDGKGYRIFGKLPVDWSLFGVKDLSNFFYTVEKTVIVDFDSYLGDAESADPHGQNR